MSMEELLVLRKTLMDLLDKGFIRASNSPATAPILPLYSSYESQEVVYGSVWTTVS